jgi:hypothetical protein
LAKFEIVGIFHQRERVLVPGMKLQFNHLFLIQKAIDFVLATKLLKPLQEPAGGLLPGEAPRTRPGRERFSPGGRTVG